MTSRLTLIGLVKYDDTLFNNLRLPDGVDKTTFTNTLLLDYGTLGAFIPISILCVIQQSRLGVISGRKVYDRLGMHYMQIITLSRTMTGRNTGQTVRISRGVNQGIMNQP